MAFNAFDLTGKGVLVTGGNGGIGLGMADAMAAAGASVCIWGTKEKKNEDAVECKYLSIFISNFVVLSLVSCTNDYRYMKYVRGRWFARRA